MTATTAIKDLLARVVGKQIATARRTTAEQTFQLLTRRGIGHTVNYDGEYVVIVEDVTLCFAAPMVQITIDLLPASVWIQQNIGPEAISAIVESLLGDIWAERRWGSDHTFDHLTSAPAKHTKRVWTKSATPALLCCGKPMTEHEPEAWGTPETDLYAERVYSCRSCGSYKRLEITDTTEAALLYTEVTQW